MKQKLRPKRTVVERKSKLWIVTLVSRWMTNYIDAMSKSLYPDTSDIPNSNQDKDKIKNDRDRIFIK